MSRTHWFGEDVETINTTLDRLPALLPVFERYGLGRNRFRDVISACQLTTLTRWKLAWSLKNMCWCSMPRPSAR